MRVLIDSSVLVSAIYSPGSVSHQAYKKAVESPFQGLVCTFTLDELRKVFHKKFPHLVPQLEQLLTALIIALLRWKGFLVGEVPATTTKTQYPNT